VEEKSYACVYSCVLILLADLALVSLEGIRIELHFAAVFAAEESRMLLFVLSKIAWIYRAVFLLRRTAYVTLMYQGCMQCLYVELRNGTYTRAAA
jgi:hypothetical protein